MLYQVLSGQVRLCQFRSFYQVMSGEIRLVRVSSVYVILSQVSSGYVRLGQVRPC